MSCSPTHTVPVRDGSPFLGVLQAINCLATIIQSLRRDKVRFIPSGQQTSLTTVRKSDAIPQNPLEDEDDDEDETPGLVMRGS